MRRVLRSARPHPIGPVTVARSFIVTRAGHDTRAEEMHAPGTAPAAPAARDRPLPRAVGLGTGPDDRRHHADGHDLRQRRAFAAAGVRSGPGLVGLRAAAPRGQAWRDGPFRE